jgi:hypothetical protein
VRYTQPLTADEERIDSALRLQHRSHADQDTALQLYRIAQRSDAFRTHHLTRVADLLLGESSL